MVKRICNKVKKWISNKNLKRHGIKIGYKVELSGGGNVG